MNDININIEETEAEAAAPEQETEKKICSEEEYVKRICDFNSFYFYLVISIAVVIGCAIAVAILVNLWAGLAMAVIGVAVYRVFICDELLKKLGIRYSTEAGELSIVSFKAVYGEKFYIPKSLIWYPVTELRDGAFESTDNSELRELYLPSSIKKIGKNLLGESSKNIKIFFEGSREDWELIEKETDLDGVEVIFNAEFPALPKKQKKEKKKKTKSTETEDTEV